MGADGKEQEKQVCRPHVLRSLRSNDLLDLVLHTRDVLKYAVSVHESAVFFSRKWFHLPESVTDITLCIYSVDEVCFSGGEYFQGCHFLVNPKEHRLEIMFCDDDSGSKFFQ